MSLSLRSKTIILIKNFYVMYCLQLLVYFNSKLFVLFHYFLTSFGNRTFNLNYLIIILINMFYLIFPFNLVVLVLDDFLFMSSCADNYATSTPFL